MNSSHPAMPQQVSVASHRDVVEALSFRKPVLPRRSRAARLVPAFGGRRTLAVPVAERESELILRQDPSDPISGSSPLRASMCDTVPL